MLKALLANGARTACRPRHVEGEGRHPGRGVGPLHFVEDTPTAVLVRPVLGAVAEFEKTTLVAKLAAARRRKRALKRPT
jgi:hypothetical protein